MNRLLAPAAMGVVFAATLSISAWAQADLFNPDRASPELDLVIENGRILDPATGRDEILNVGISDGEIVALTSGELTGAQVIDATGHTVIPGFIDLHTHSPFPYGELLQAKDGVTTALDLEAGAFPVAEYGAFLSDGARINFGSSVGHAFARIKVIEGKDQPWAITENGQFVPGPAFMEIATDQQIEEIRKLLQLGLDNGGLGIGFLLDYMSPAISDDELRMIFEVAAANNTVIWAHIRRGIDGDIQPLLDLLPLARELGVKLHICHINANAMGAVGDWLGAIDEANANGADVSAEIFPYTAGSTTIQADVFDRDWQTIFGISYEDVQWGTTGEFFTEESWYRIREEHPDSNIIHHYMKEEWLVEALKWPEMMVATDAMPAFDYRIKAAPNGAGSYTRLLAHFVRDLGVIDLMDAVKRGSYYPAERLAEFAPVFKRKGRIEEGADADLLIFKLENLKDNATYTDPFREASGWDFVIVGGEVVVQGGDPTGAKPGRHIFNSGD